MSTFYLCYWIYRDRISKRWIAMQGGRHVGCESSKSKLIAKLDAEYALKPVYPITAR